MEFAMARFTIDTNEMYCALYCAQCGQGDPAPNYEWRAVPLTGDDASAFSCDQCHTTEPEYVSINRSAEFLSRIEARANGRA